MRTGAPVGTSVGLAPDKQIITRPDGSQVVVDKNAPAGTELAPAAKPGDVIPTQEQELFAINKARDIRGEKPLTAEELIKMKQQPGVNINVGTDGSSYPAPEKGYDYKRGADGKVIVDPDTHQVSYYKIPEGGPATEAAQVAKADAEKAKKEASAQRLKMASASAVVRSADEAMDIIDKSHSYLPAAGFAAAVGQKFGGTAATDLKSKLSEITANTAFTQLKAMRDASSSGASGLGQVTDFEQRMLSNATANIDPGQSIPQLKRQLRKVQATMLVLADNSFNEKDADAYNNALDAKVKELETKAGATKGKYGNIRVKE
jgi:hypothetical protein